MENTLTTTELQNTGEEVHEAAPASEQISHESTLFAEPIAHFGSFPVTNALVTSWAAVFIIIILSLALRLGLKKVPGKLQFLFETVWEGGLSLADQVTNNRKKSLTIFPIAISIFFFVLINNWLGILPLGGFGLVEHSSEGLAFIPFVRSGTADVNTTIALALMAVIGANLFGIISIGVWKMFNKYVNLKALGGIFTKVKHDPTIVIVAPITFFVGILEIIGEVAKVASLSFRLFGNVFAGEVLLASMTALVAYAVPIPFLFLEILVGVIQALIFSMLTLVYFTIASEDHEAHDEHDVPAFEESGVAEMADVSLH
jgi:F-type H+-transporting ATPase subunit a